MSARGGPLAVAGYESELISVADFHRHCKGLIDALEVETECGQADEEIRVDDLKFLSPEHLINIAVEHTAPQDVCVTNTAGKIKSGKKKRSKGQKWCRAMLQTDPHVERMLAMVIEERDTAKANAAATLHSLRSLTETHVEGDKHLAKGLPAAGPLKFLREEEPLARPSDGNNTIAPGADVLIWIEFHSRTNVKVQELVVLGSQSLCEFRDQLHCTMDELASKKNLGSSSGYFFIENVFYNDLRQPDAVDYSENLISWLQQQDDIRKLKRARGKITKLPCFTKASMADTCFRNLELKLGVKYLYCHQGDCKHFFVFRDVRLIHEDDVRSRSSYPAIRLVPRVRHRKCNICAVYRARKVVRDDKLAPVNPCFFCDGCYYSLHYTKDGVPVYEDFSVEDYYHE